MDCFWRENNESFVSREYDSPPRPPAHSCARGRCYIADKVQCSSLAVCPLALLGGRRKKLTLDGRGVIYQRTQHVHVTCKQCVADGKQKHLVGGPMNFLRKTNEIDQLPHGSNNDAVLIYGRSYCMAKPSCLPGWPAVDRFALF
jgi:hypothetical protein